MKTQNSFEVTIVDRIVVIMYSNLKTMCKGMKPQRLALCFTEPHGEFQLIVKLVSLNSDICTFIVRA